MTLEELQEIASRCDAATPGPWRSFVENRDHDSGSNFIRTPTDDIEMLDATHADQDFIAAARQDIPRMIAALRDLLGR